MPSSSCPKSESPSRTMRLYKGNWRGLYNTKDDLKSMAPDHLFQWRSRQIIRLFGPKVHVWQWPCWEGWESSCFSPNRCAAGLPTFHSRLAEYCGGVTLIPTAPVPPYYVSESRETSPCDSSLGSLVVNIELAFKIGISLIYEKIKQNTRQTAARRQLCWWFGRCLLVYVGVCLTLNFLCFTEERFGGLSFIFSKCCGASSFYKKNFQGWCPAIHRPCFTTWHRQDSNIHSLPTNSPNQSYLWMSTRLRCL